MSAQSCQPHWDGAIGQPGMNSWINALAVFDDGSGSGPALYAGGNFTSAGGVPANFIAKWDGTSWSPLGSGVNASVWSMAVFDDGLGAGPALYVGGDFTAAGDVDARRIAKWDGSSWSPLGNGRNGRVWALTAFDDESGAGPRLYAGGLFSVPGGWGIARWNGSSWSNLGAMNHLVIALTVSDDGSGAGRALYAGGFFTKSGGVETNRIAKWNGSKWSALGSGMNEDVRALAGFDDGAGMALYAGGPFTTAGGVEANRVARWDGSSWSPLGNGTSAIVRALTVFDDGSGTGPALFAGGDFKTASGATVNYIARWDGTSWSAVESGMAGPPLALTAIDGGDSKVGPALYAGGFFTAASGTEANYIATWRRPAQAGPADLNCDGVVGVDDLMILLQTWGPCAECAECYGDLDGDCRVGVADLLILLANWG